MSLAPGTRLGPYEIIAPIGAGGMGEVYRAKDTRLNRDVAIKVLPTSFANDPDRRARFEREAQAIAALSHPNVIAIFDTGLHDPATGSGEAAQLYVVMELLAGSTLRDRLTSGALPVRKAVEIAVQIARGLGAAHSKGIVHRDLKPENIFLLEDGQVKILDFGLARQTSESDQGGATRTMALTGAGTVLGTVGYMAPEQVRGQAVDARADVFAFGAVLYEMVSGQRAYQRDTAADTMTAILTQDPPELTGTRPDLSPALDRIIRHCLEKNANERFQNARDATFALEALSGSNVSTTGSGETAVIPVASSRRSRAGVVLAAAVVGALVLGAGAGYFGRGTTAPESAGAVVTYKPVSFEEGFVFAARFSPDHRTVVYSADWDGGPREVFVTSIDSLDYRSLGFPGADLLGISRSGELAILTGSKVTGGNAYYRIGTMARASLTGGAPRAELEGVRFADFSPDGAMAVVREDSLRQTIEYPVGHVIAEGVLAGSQLGSGRTPFSAPRVSPSGDYVAYFDLRVKSAITVKIFNRAGKMVAESQPFADWWALAWTPSNEVWFSAAPVVGSQTSIYALDLKGHERTVYRAPGAITLHDISSDGDVLVSFDQGRERLELLGAGDATPQDRSWREGGRIGALSNDRAVLINGNGDSAGPKGSVYFSVSAGAQPVRIADGTPLALSHDGAKALVLSLQSPPQLSIVPTGAGQAQILDLGSIEAVPWAGWLSDGRVAAQVIRPGAKFETLLISTDGQKPIALLPKGMTLSASNAGANLVSPDGGTIIAIDQEGHVVTCTISTTACHPLPGAALNESVAGWSADGRSVFVYSGTVGTSQVDRVDVTTGKRTPWKTLHPLAPAVSGMRNIIAAPDGTLLYGYSNNKSQLYVIKGLR